MCNLFHCRKFKLQASFVQNLKKCKNLKSADEVWVAGAGASLELNRERKHEPDSRGAVGLPRQ